MATSSDSDNKSAFFYKQIELKECIFLRLNIPPFVPARAVLSGLELEDPCGNEKPVKNERGDTKVKELLVQIIRHLP